jgi:NAD(P)-dependent dehydrogenase (short-subunit alcohol dehydrogenase family)
VAVCDLFEPTNTVDAVEQAGAHCVGLVADVADPAAVATLTSQVHEHLGPISVLVNGVGISPYIPFRSMTFDEWRTVMRVNLDSVFLVTSAFLPDMIDAGWGRVLNFTSSMAWDAQARDVVHYANSKLGVVGFTRALAGEVGQYGITVNCIAPGIVETPALLERVPPERWEVYLDRQAVKAIAVPEDLLGAVSVLVSDGAAAITGITLPINSGRVWL